jgi:hypothetical protein
MAAISAHPGDVMARGRWESVVRDPADARRAMGASLDGAVVASQARGSVPASPEAREAIMSRRSREQ